MPVEFISNGYDTTSSTPYTEQAWADAHPSIGLATYGVRSATHWKVTAVAGQDRTVSIAAGQGFGHGVTDKTVANDTIQLDTIATGSRWDLIAVRRDWTPTAGVSKFVKVNGGSTAVIPGGRNANPGGIDDQPLALVQVTAGQTQPTGLIDLRTWAGDGGGLVAAHDLVRSFLNKVGTQLHIDGVTWVRKSGANDTPEWVKTGEIGVVDLFGAHGNTFGGNPPNGGSFLVQAGSHVGRTDNSGYGRIAWPKPFPNGVLTVMLTNGDGYAVNDRVTFAVTGNGNFWGASGGGGKQDVVFSAFNANANGLVPNLLCRVNWIAIGW